ncbi:uncharacterized protein PAC_00268 [Phialocephala subalpina]|uniref:Uncharacterized protein n=1 Tax=Phialocephala subalpina TaxID=576137 RepID=A0A1L7WC91_9HELO|nr:uncharacterized protein PAC_00268 [Phialocephala subalpina]
MKFLGNYIAALVGAGIVIFLESEYSAWRLFQRRQTLFFCVCQLAILSSALFNGISAYAYFTPAVEIVPLYTVNTIVEILMVVSYPTMILLRLRLIYHLHPLVLCAPMLQGILWLVLGIYQTKFALTKDQHFYRVGYILQLTGMVLLMVQDVIINVFFIRVARKNFSDVIHIRYVIAVNMMVIALQIASAALTIGFFYIDNSALKIIPVIEPIKVSPAASVDWNCAAGGGPGHNGLRKVHANFNKVFRKNQLTVDPGWCAISACEGLVFGFGNDASHRQTETAFARD